MELKGWKATVVLWAAILQLVSVVLTIPLFITLGFMH